MQIAHGSARFDFHVDQSAEADVQGGKAGRVHLGIGNECDVGLQFCRIRGHVFRYRQTADFFFALDEELDIDGHAAVDRFDGFHRLDVGKHLALVVSRSARIEISVALGRFEGRRLP